MTWGQLKSLLATAGVKDTDQIVYIDIGEASIQVLDRSTPQDPDGLRIFFQDEADGSRLVTIA